MQNLINKLRQKADFLQFSLAEPSLAYPLTFHLKQQTQVSLIAPGVICFTPLVQQPVTRQILLSCGVHGDETAPIEIVNQLVKEIMSGQLAVGSPLLVILGNLSAIKANKRFIDTNLNRLFNHPDKVSASVGYEAKRAQQLKQVLADFYRTDRLDQECQRFHYDLHASIRPSRYPYFAICPYLQGGRCADHQLAFLARCGIQALVLLQRPAATLSYCTSHYWQSHSFTLELGQLKPPASNDLNEFSQLINQLKVLISGQQAKTKNLLATDLALFKVSHEIIKQSTHFKLHLAAGVINFSALAKNFLLYQDNKVDYRLPYQQSVIVFPNPNVALGQRAGLVCQPMSEHDL